MQLKEKGGNDVENKGLLVHKHNAPKLYLIAKTLLIYLALFVMWVWTVNLYVTFGLWIKIAVTLMLIGGLVGILFIPEDRENTLKETRWALFGYLAFLLVYRIVIVQFSQFSPDEVGTSLGVNMPVASATSALGFVQNILMIISIMVPVGYLIWIGQKFKVHSGRKAKDETFEKYKGLRKDYHGPGMG